MTQQEMKKVLEIGVMLSSEHEPARLMDKILTSVMEVSHCDAGMLYMLDEDVLRVRIMHNRTLGTCEGGDGKVPDLPPVPLTRKKACAYALLEGKTVSIPDVYACDRYDFTGTRSYDAVTGYHTQSMLVVPMINRSGESIGVLQLINALDEQGRICAFPEDMTLVLESVASQAAITIQNVWYVRDIRGLLDSFVKVMSSAIDERTPYNASHTRHMAACAEHLIDFLNKKALEETGELRFTDEQKKELLMSVWLHDVGKLVTPLEIMNKAARLTPEQHMAVRHRLEKIGLLGRIGKETGVLTQEEYEALTVQTEEVLRLVEQVNTAGFLPDESVEQIRALSERTYTDTDGREQPWLTPEECGMLTIRRGTLSEAERQVMEEHVRITDRLLSQIRFSPEFSHVRQWAAAHHELLDGAGYPDHLEGEQIPREVRIITILDIFDALVADDRPYKPGMPVEEALSILTDMAEREGKLDQGLTELFIESRCWEAAGYDFVTVQSVTSDAKPVL